MWQVHKSHRCRQTDFCELHPGELRRERGRLIWLKKKKNHREQEPLMLCIYKIAAVSNGNDVLCSQKLSDGLNRFSPSVCVTVTQSQETATCLIRKKATDVREAKQVAFYWEEQLHIQLYWELLLHYLPFTSEPRRLCTSRQCTVNLRFCELFITFQVGLWAALILHPILFFYIHLTYGCFFYALFRGVHYELSCFVNKSRFKINAGFGCFRGKPLLERRKKWRRRDFIVVSDKLKKQFFSFWGDHWKPTQAVMYAWNNMVRNVSLF